MSILTPNKFAGQCACGAQVDAGAGFFRGIVYCQQPNDLNRCPIEQANLDAAFKEKQEWQDKVFMESYREPIVGPGVCDKCEGDGKYVFSNGAVGPCYPCSGTGIIK